MTKPLPIKTKGLKRRFNPNKDECYDEKCLACLTKLKQIRSLYDFPNSIDLNAFAEKRTTMEATVYECPNCGKAFIETELYDYDSIKIEEIENECWKKLKPRLVFISKVMECSECKREQNQIRLCKKHEKEQKELEK